MYTPKTNLWLRLGRTSSPKFGVGDANAHCPAPDFQKNTGQNNHGKTPLQAKNNSFFFWGGGYALSPIPLAGWIPPVA